MSYTTVEQLRGHLVNEFPVADLVENQVVTLVDQNDVTFYGGPIDPASIVVKSVRQHLPARQLISLVSAGVQISILPLVPGSVVVAGDSSLGNIYQQSRDYLVDYRLGTIYRTSTGLIAEGSNVVVWSIPFHLFIASDVVVDSDGGAIRRSASSQIGSHEQVMIDYRPTVRSTTEEMLSYAATTANLLIEQEIDPNRQFETEPMLGAAATYRALEIICRTSAARELSSKSAQQQVANAWIALAEQHDRRSRELLAQFRPPAAGLRHPEQA